MIKIGVTGQNGFIGTHIYNSIPLFPVKYKRIDFEKSFFEDKTLMDEFVAKCDVIIHLAAMNRHKDPEVIYETNIGLVNSLVNSLKSTNSKAHVLFSSSTQEDADNSYGRSKTEGRLIFEKWSNNSAGNFTGLIVPNVFGPFGLPYYNSVVATFCHELSNGLTPKINNDSILNLIHVDDLVNIIFREIDNFTKSKKTSNKLNIKATDSISVSELLSLLNNFKSEYLESGIIPFFSSKLHLNLFNTFRSFINLENHFPVKYTKHSDTRGEFVEIIRLKTGGQVSFSTTVPGITRGNHFHTRKIERFSVIKGKALIQLRKIGTNKIINLYLDGENTAYVDMPIWYTHNIKNIGEEVLYTNFWINEPYDPENADTYFVEV